MPNMYKGKDWPEYTSETEEYPDVISWKALRYFITRDFERINRRITFKKLIRSLLFEPGFQYVFWMRITRYTFINRHWLLYAPARMILKHLGYKYSFDISYRARIMPGFAIGHWGCIIIQGSSVIGSNCFVRPGVVMGKKSVYEGGSQVIGDNVEFGAGAKCIGSISIGNNVMIGANAVVTKDIPSNCVVAGVPARIIKKNE